MRLLLSAAAGTAVIVVVGVVASAQVAARLPGPAERSSRPPLVQDAAQVKVTGCVQRESEYRRMQSASPVGAIDGEYVLINAGVSARVPEEASGTSAVATGSVLEVTGANEGQMGLYIGRWVEVLGTLAAPVPPASGRSSDRTPSLGLPRLDIDSVRTLSGACAAH